MAEYVYLNGEYVLKQEAKIPVMTHAFLYGTSVFEGIRAYYNKDEDQLYAFRVKEHMERIMNSCKIMHMHPDTNADKLCDITKELLRKNAYKSDAYIRPTIFKAAERIGPGLYNNPDGVLLFSMEMGDYIDTSKGLSVCVSNWRRLDDNMIPPRAKVSGAYANTALIVTDARIAGFDDAIVLSPNGKVTEGSAMNFFMIEKGRLVTSRKSDNILIGITRNTIIELARNVLNLEVEEREIDRTELYTADEAFYCGTGAQVSPVVKIDNRDVGTGKVGEIVSKIQSLYLDVVKGKVKEYKRWCMPVYQPA